MAGFAKPPCDEAIIRATRASEQCSGRAAPWVLATTILGSSLVFVDGTVVNVALPALQAGLSATIVDVQWVVEAYALLLASLLLVGGSLGDRYGRRRVFCIGVAVFAASSAWCGAAPDVTHLIIARGVQGIGGALLVPNSLAIVGASFAEQERGQALGTWSGFTGMTAVVGPVLGGFLIDHYSWRWVFLINLPIAAVVLILACWHVPESRDEEAVETLDWLGAVLVTVGLGGIVYGLIESSNKHWSHPSVVVGLVGGFLALIAFVAIELKAPSPMLPLALFRSRNFTGANLLTFLLYGALGGALFFFPLNLIQVQGYSATSAGAALVPFVLIMFVLSRWAGGLADRFGAKMPLTVGPAIVAVGFALFARPRIGGSYWITFFPAVLVLGFGMAISVAPLTTTVLNAVGKSSLGIASGVNNAVSRTAALVALALLGIVMALVFNHSLDQRFVKLHAPLEVTQVIHGQREKLAAAEIPTNVDEQLGADLRKAVDESFVAGFRRVMLIAAALSLLGAATAVLMIGGKS